MLSPSTKSETLTWRNPTITETTSTSRRCVPNISKTILLVYSSLGFDRQTKNSSTSRKKRKPGGC